MTQHHGGGEAWQASATRQWVGRLATESPPRTVAVLDGQVRPSVVRAALAAFPGLLAEIILIDCSQVERDRRLRELRHQPALASAQMAAWAAYLRGQADALGLALIDTTDTPIAEAATLLEQRALALRRRVAG
jgi:hypothetical protein